MFVKEKFKKKPTRLRMNDHVIDGNKDALSCPNNYLQNNKTEIT